MVEVDGGWSMVDSEGACSKTVSSNSNEIKNKEKHTWGSRHDAS